jgi:hypothetical protein
MANTNTVPQALFGPGVAILTRTDGGDATPFNIGFINELSIDWAFDTKQLKGQYQFPLMVARGTAKTSGKIKAATLSGRALNTLLFGGTWTTGTQYGLTQSVSVAIPATPFTITASTADAATTIKLPNTGTFSSDCGVVNAATGEPLALVTGTPSAGQYAHTAGAYLFSTADNVSGISVKISYVYTWTSGSAGQYQIITNQLIGTTPTFHLDYSTILYGAEYLLQLYACVGGKSAMAHKLEDFMMPEYDFEFYADTSQHIGLVSLATTG